MIRIQRSPKAIQQSTNTHKNIVALENLFRVQLPQTKFDILHLEWNNITPKAAIAEKNRGEEGWF